MIPGVLKGVIASSWLRASDQLRAPNAITTGQEIPNAYVEVRSHFATEMWLMAEVSLSAVQNAGTHCAIVSKFAVQKNQPLRLRTSILAVIRKAV